MTVRRYILDKNKTRNSNICFFECVMQRATRGWESERGTVDVGRPFFWISLFRYCMFHYKDTVDLVPDTIPNICSTWQLKLAMQRWRRQAPDFYVPMTRWGASRRTICSRMPKVCRKAPAVFKTPPAWKVLDWLRRKLCNSANVTDSHVVLIFVTVHMALPKYNHKVNFLVRILHLGSGILVWLEYCNWKLNYTLILPAK